MSFKKSFPVRTDKSVYPKWEEIVLTPEEEVSVDEKARHANIEIMQESIHDATRMLENNPHLKLDHEDLVNIAKSLFEKRASHTVYWKEELARKKLDQKNESSLKSK